MYTAPIDCCCPCRSAYQGYGSARSDMSAPGDDASAMLRPLASPARSQLGSHGSVLGPGSSSSSNNSSSNIATAAKGIINRTPLTNRQGSDSTADDSIIVADKARLSLLLNNDPSNQSSAMARVNSPGYPGNPTSSAAEGFNQVAPPSSMQPSGSGDNGRLTPNQGVYGSNSPVPLSPHTAKFRVSSEIIAGAEAVYNQLPSSATSTLNRPLPVRPTGDRGTPMYASPKKVGVAHAEVVEGLRAVMRLAHMSAQVLGDRVRLRVIMASHELCYCHVHWMM